jgi:hypothetical protein
MNRKKSKSLPSVERSVVKVEHPDLDAYFASVVSITSLQPGEFTRDMARQRWNGLSVSATNRRLIDDVRRGVLKRREGLIDGVRVSIYSIAK